MERKHWQERGLSKDQARGERMGYAVSQLENIGVEITWKDKTSLHFYHKGQKVIFWPFTGWASGKSIKDGRGINNLIKQLKNG